jgi:hypothetical protein
MKHTPVNQDSRKYPRTVSLSIGIWNAIDARAEHGERSAYVEQAVVERIEREEKAK